MPIGVVAPSALSWQVRLFHLRTCLQGHLQTSPPIPHKSYVKFQTFRNTFQNRPLFHPKSVYCGGMGVPNFCWVGIIIFFRNPCKIPWPVPFLWYFCHLFSMKYSTRHHNSWNTLKKLVISVWNLTCSSKTLLPLQSIPPIKFSSVERIQKGLAYPST